MHIYMNIYKHNCKSAFVSLTYNHRTFIRSSLLGAFATISFVMSVVLSIRPPQTTRLPLYGFPFNLTFQYFSSICPEKFEFH